MSVGQEIFLSVFSTVLQAGTSVNLSNLCPTVDVLLCFSMMEVEKPAVMARI